MQGTYTRYERDGATWVTAPLGDHWYVSHRIGGHRGRPRILETRMEPAATGAPPLTARILRRVRLTGWEKAVADGAGGESSAFASDETRRRVSSQARSGKRLRGRVRAWLLADMAGAYARAWQDGHRNVNEVLADELETSTKWVTDRIADARHSGYLTPTKQGRSGGELTEEGWRVLRERYSSITKLSERLEETRAAMDRTVRQWPEVTAWLRERAAAEGVDRSSMNAGEWHRWSEQRLEAPDSPLRTHSIPTTGPSDGVQPGPIRA